MIDLLPLHYTRAQHRPTRPRRGSYSLRCRMVPCRSKHAGLSLVHPITTNEKQTWAAFIPGGKGGSGSAAARPCTFHAAGISPGRFQTLQACCPWGHAALSRQFAMSNVVSFVVRLLCYFWRHLPLPPPPPPPPLPSRIKAGAGRARGARAGGAAPLICARRCWSSRGGRRRAAFPSQGARRAPPRVGAT